MMKSTRLLKPISLTAGLLVSVATFAEQTPGASWGIGLSANADDNVLKQHDDIASSDSWVSLTPKLSLLALLGKHQLNASYQGEISVFDKQSDLNFSNHQAKLNLLLDHDYRLKTEFLLTFDDKIEEAGSTNNLIENQTEFVELQTSLLQGKLYYGNIESTGQLVFALDKYLEKYQNNNQEFRDFDRNSFTTTFFYRVAPKSRLLAEASIEDYQYDAKPGLIDQSSKRVQLLAGVEWQATAKTTSVFKIGYQDKSFDHESFNNISDLSLYLDMYWQTSPQTLITIGGSRTTAESAINEISAFVRNSLSLALEHRFTERTRVNAAYRFNQDDIAATDSREDKRNKISIAFSHSLRDWLDVSFGYQFMQRDSNIALFEFDSNRFHLSLDAHFD